MDMEKLISVLIILVILLCAWSLALSSLLVHLFRKVIAYEQLVKKAQCEPLRENTYDSKCLSSTIKKIEELEGAKRDMVSRIAQQNRAFPPTRENASSTIKKLKIVEEAKRDAASRIVRRMHVKGLKITKAFVPQNRMSPSSKYIKKTLEKSNSTHDIE